MKILRTKSSLLALLLVATAPNAQVLYRITDIGAVSDLNPESVEGVAISDKGAIVGQMFDPSADPTVSAFLWRQGRLTALPGIASISVGAGARAINNHSVIVGVATADDLSDHAVLWRNGQVIDLHDLPGGPFFTLAADINDRGDIVGSGFTGTSFVAVLARNGRIVSLGDLPGGQETSDATAINNRREIVGSGFTDEGERAFLWRNGVMEDLGVLPGAAGDFFFSRANDINDRGEVVGTGNGFNDPFSNNFGFVWREGQMEPLPPLIGHTSAANGINEKGDIVGSSEDQAAIWHTGGQPDLLRDLVDPNDPNRQWVGLEIARSINELGQIIVTGRDSRLPNTRTFLLTPIRVSAPPP